MLLCGDSRESFCKKLRIHIRIRGTICEITSLGSFQERSEVEGVIVGREIQIFVVP